MTTLSWREEGHFRFSITMTCFSALCGSLVKVSLARLQLDYYPYHLARGERKHWVRYPADSPHRAWLQVGGLESQLWSKLNLQSGLAQFDTRLLDELLSGQNKAPLSRCKKLKKILLWSDLF